MFEYLTLVLVWLVSGHSGLTLRNYFVNALFAALGSSVSAFATNPSIRLPHKKDDGTLEVGTIGQFVIGLATSIAIGYDIPVAFISGLLAPIVVPFLLTSVVPAIAQIVKGSIVNSVQRAASAVAPSEKGE